MRVFKSAFESFKVHSERKYFSKILLNDYKLVNRTSKTMFFPLFSYLPFSICAPLGTIHRFLRKLDKRGPLPLGSPYEQMEGGQS